MQTTLRKMGNSTDLIIPKAVLAELGLTQGTKMKVRVEDGKVVAEPVRKVREGWEEDAKIIGALAQTEDEREWLDAPLDPDFDWKW